jgi:hypothetical protein
MRPDVVRLQDNAARIRVAERFGMARTNEPVRVGVPFQRGLVFDAGELIALDQNSRTIPSQCRVLASWPDGSVKWMLVDMLVSAKANEHVVISLQRQASVANAAQANNTPALTVAEEAGRIVVNTGAGQFGVARDAFGPLRSVRINSTDLLATTGSDVRLRTADGVEYSQVIDCLRLEEGGPVRASILVEGGFAHGGRRLPVLFKSRLIFYADSTRVRMEFQIRNPRAAHHPGGLWDLGDGGSCQFADLSVRLHPRAVARGVQWYVEDPGQAQREDSACFSLYQDSSGGENWNSPNHVDARGKATVSFPGYRVTVGSGSERKSVSEGRRASPYLRVSFESGWIAATIKDFWQNFPKALRVDDGKLSIGLFPSESQSGFELQGGEQKRHIVFLDFGEYDREPVIPSMQNPLVASIDPSWVEQTEAILWFGTTAQEEDQHYLKYINNIIEGPDSFFRKREVVDEYGWRNFGDLYADHEAIHHRGPKPMVAHYNNQYDFIYGALVQFLKTGDSRWQRLMENAAEHTIDIDIYHTDQDRPAYNHGLFWHTDHYQDAATCTHRTYSRKNAAGAYGGGPSNEHNYTSGLLHYYYVTGDSEAANAVVELADWVIAMDDGAKTILGLVDDGPTGAASQTVSRDFHKPGRGAGNSINALIDCHALTGVRRYFTKAEELIQRCIHPEDDLAALKLDEPEYRWSYLVFLQVLGKYLDTKIELGERDYCFHYARESLLHYADWMAQNEVPYKDVLHKVLRPTESWPAHDIRKCHVFHLAAKYGPSAKKPMFSEKAAFFFDRCLADVLSFETAYLTRPLVILCAFGYVHTYFLNKQFPGDADRGNQYDFGRAEIFLSQRARVGRVLSRKLRMAASEIERLSLAKWREWKSRFLAKH